MQIEVDLHFFAAHKANLRIFRAVRVTELMRNEMEQRANVVRNRSAGKVLGNAREKNMVTKNVLKIVK